MIRTLLLGAVLAGPANADLPANFDEDILLDAVTLAAAQNTRLEDVVAPNGIKTSQMEPDGTTPITFQDGSTRNVQLDFIGAYTDGTCTWALQPPGGPQFNFTKSLMTQARLTEDGWPDEMIDTTDTLSDAECIARSALVVLDNPCMALLPIRESDSVYHFAVDVPELCQ